MMKKMMIAAAGAAMTLASVGSAHAGSASALSLGNAPAVRASSDTGDANQLMGNTFAIGLAILVALAVVVIVVEKEDSN